MKKMQECLNVLTEPPIPCKFDLARRISKFFHPEAPKGSHSGGLELIKRVFEVSFRDETNFKEDLALFSGGLFPLFQSTSPANKETILELLERYFLPLGMKITFSIPGIVCALLSGVSEENGLELEGRAMQVLDKLGHFDKDGLMGALWQSLIRSPRVRIGGIRYLMTLSTEEMHNSLPQLELIVNAFIACLNDKDEAVQVQVLELLNKYFPLDTESLQAQEKVHIVQVMMVLGTAQSPEVTDRIWQWCDVGGGEAKRVLLLQLVVPVLGNLFRKTPETAEEALAPLEVYEMLLSVRKLRKRLFGETTGMMLKYTKNLQDDSRFSKGVLEKSMFLLNRHYEHRHVMWGALKGALEQSVGEKNVRPTVEVIEFFLKVFTPSVVSPGDCDYLFILSILEYLLPNIHVFPFENIQEGVLLSNLILRKIKDIQGESFTQAVDLYHSFFQSMSQDIIENNSKECSTFNMACNLAISLEKYTGGDSDLDWIDNFFICMDSDNIEISLIGIEYLVDLVRNDQESYSRARQKVLGKENVNKRIIEKLWGYLATEKHRNKCVDIIISLNEVNPKVFTNFVIHELSGTRVSEGIKRFSLFWQTMNDKHKRQIQTIFGKGEVILNVLDHLNHPSAEIKYYAKQWVLDSLESITYIVDPILSFILSQLTLNTEHGKGLLEIYDSKLVQVSMVKLKNIVSNGSFLFFDKAKKIISKTIQIKLKPPLNEKNWTYIELFIELPLFFIRFECIDAGFTHEHQSIQAASCELLCILLSHKNPDLAYSCVYEILLSLQRNILKKDNVMQLLVLKVLFSIFFHCDIEQEKKKLKILINSNEFKWVYSKFLETSDSYVRTHWINFISSTFKTVVASTQPIELPNIVHDLITSFCGMIQPSEDNEIVFSGLSVIIREIMSLAALPQLGRRASLTPKGFLERKTPPPPKTISVFEKVSKLFSAGDEVKEANTPHKQTLNTLFNQFQLIVLQCLQCIPLHEDEMNIRITGISPYSDQPEIPVLKDTSTLELLTPIIEDFPVEFVSAVCKIWIQESTRLDYEFHQESEILPKLMRICISFKVHLAVLLSCIHTYIAMDLNLHQFNKKKSVIETDEHEVPLAALIYALVSYLPRESLSLESEEQKDTWLCIIRIIKEFESSSVKSMSIWILELMALFLKRLPYTSLLRDKRMLKECQDIILRSFNKLSNVYISDHSPIRPPVPPSSYTHYHQHSSVLLDLASLFSLDSTLYYISSVLWENVAIIVQGYSIQFIQLITTSSIEEVNSKLKTELVTRTIANLLESTGEKLSRVCRKDLIEYITSPEFFANISPNEYLLSQWSKILNNLSVFCYRENDLITEILKKFPTGLFVAKETEFAHRTRMLNCVGLVIYSGEEDGYAFAAPQLCETIKEYLRLDDYFIPSVFFFFRVMLLKFSAAKISEVWPSIWPHIHTHLMKIIETKENLEHFLAALKLLQFLLLSNSEEFHLYRWIFFCDGDGGAQGFVPLMNRLVGVGEVPLMDDLIISENSISDEREAIGLANKLIAFIEQRASGQDRELMSSLIIKEFLGS